MVETLQEKDTVGSRRVGPRSGENSELGQEHSRVPQERSWASQVKETHLCFGSLL